MLRSRGKRVVAGFLALTLFLTSGFLILFRDSVFGARNNNSAVEPNYIDEASKTGVSVSVRGKGSQGSVILTDEGSNQKDKLPNTFYKGWEFNGEDGTISIPSTIGKKGSKDNPFVVLEVVPDKGMQEMPYFVGGGDDTGLGFDEGYLSATLMEQLRERNGESFRLTNGAFTVERMNNDPNLKNAYDNYINNYITTKLDGMFGRFLQSKFNVFGIGQEVDETASTNDTLQMVDVYNNEGADKVGTYNFNEIYNISITTDDLLQILPTKVIRSLGANPSASEIANDRAENKWAFHEISNKNEIFEREYTQDLIAFVAAETNKTTDQLTAVDIENYIKDVLCGVSLGYNQLTDKNGNNQINKTTEIIKYNLKDFSQADWLKPGLGQDITYLDYEDSEIFDFYDISQSIVRRGSGYNTRHYELKQRGEDGKGTFSYLPGSPKKEVSNYWKVQFRKKYIDTFTSYFADYKAKDEAWKAAEPTNPNESLSNSAMNKLRARNAALEKLMKTFAPFFESKGVNIKTMSDPMNWETTTKTVLSNVREYKIDHAGGYILAVKPGMGDMYLLNDNQISNIVDKFSDEEKEAMGVNSSDYLNKTFVFSRDDLDSVVDGEVTDNTNQRRWIFVPTSFALDGDMTPHKDYHPGYLDDSDYTYGFASKTVRNKDDITLAIYDRSNRRHHGRNESGKNDFNKANVGNFSFKSTESFNLSGQLVNNGALSFDIENFSKKMLYYTDDETYAAGTDYVNYVNNYSGRAERYLDSFHQNVWKQISKSKTEGGLGIGFGSEGHQFIDNNDNLIDKSGRSYVGELGSDWLFNNRGKDYITGLCFNFRDIGVSTDGSAKDTDDYADENGVVTVNPSGTNPYLSIAPDIYSKEWINGFDYRSVLYKSLMRIQGLSQTGNRRKIEESRYVDAADAKYYRSGTRNVDKYGNLGDEVQLIDSDIRVRETVTNYNFTYYGFKANSILSRSMFNFKDQAEFDDFHIKVIVVTPAELNQIAQAAKDYNLDDNSVEGYTSKNEAKEKEIEVVKGLYDVVDGDTYEQKEAKKNSLNYAEAVWNSAGWNAAWKDVRLTNEELANANSGKLNLKVRLDLIERADMFYIHTMRTSRKSDSVLYKNNDNNNGGTNNDDIDLAYQFYKEIAKEGQDGEAGKENFYKMDTFFENDLEWDQVAKLIKRSSLDNGINIPILFNMLVGHMTDVAVDAGDTKVRENAEDTHMRLFSNPNRIDIGNGLQSSWQEYKYNYAGNLNNIGKLYTILTQFDLHAVRNSLVNPEETDVNQRRFVRRTFMGDIFPRISVANIDTAYKPSDHDRVENSAKTTGVVEEMEAFSEGDRAMYNKKAYRSRVRVLCQDNDGKNEQFESNPMYLWNRFTFYPYDVVTEDDQRAVLNSSDMNSEMKIRFLEWGYLESFYAGATNSNPIFQQQAMDQSLRRRVGTDGTDGQNVYVLHWPNNYDNENAGQSLLGNWGQTPGQTNNLLNMSYKIMGYPGKARAVEIKARPRNKVYTLMGRDEGTFTDHVMLDYYTTRNLYTPEELIRLDTEEKNIMISAFNPNSEPAFITSITLHRSYEENDTGDGDTGGNTGQGDNTSGNTSGVSGDEGDDEDNDNETDTGNGEAVPLIMVGDDTPGGTPIDLGSVLKKDNATNVEVETNYAVDGQTKTGERIQQGQGILINPTKTLYFHIPYTLKDFFEKRVENGEEIGGYDKIVIYGYYYTKNQKDHTMSIVGMKDVINISERELFDLE